MNYFSLNTNVKELRIGDNSSKGIDKEIGKYIVFTMKIPWDVLKKNLTKTPEKIIFVESVEKDIIDNEIDNLDDFDTVLGVGGGMAIDCAKYTS